VKLRTDVSMTTKHKLSHTLRTWLHILKADLESLNKTLKELSKENPFIEIQAGNEIKSSSKKSYQQTYQKNVVSNEIEALISSKKSLYDKLYEQIEAPLFPTKRSINIAFEIIENINDDGYFDGSIKDIAKKLDTTLEQVERVRKRFAYLEPSGVGSIDLYESFLFQLNDFDLEPKLFDMCVKLINNFENIQNYKEEPYFYKAVKIIKKMKNPPAIEYKSEVLQVIPDIFIENRGGDIKIRLNDAYYPKIVIDTGGLDNKSSFVKNKIEKAKLLVEALNLRKETLLKIALSLIEYQYDFFMGKEIKPMKLDDLSRDLDRHHSTISRAISNKYLSCERGIFPLKSFFATALDEEREISNAAIKAYIQKIVKNEDRKKPLSDSKIMDMVNEKFNTAIGRRTVTKYRIAMGIRSSSDRKKIYQLEVN
jgi:RNA polymerase sigma-54 factor